MRLDELTIKHFEGRLGEAFRIHVPEYDEPLDGELVEVEQAVLAGSAEGRTPFSLVFRGPVDPLLPQGIYELGHEQLGLLPLFIVPIAQDDDGVRYQAVFT